MGDKSNGSLEKSITTHMGLHILEELLQGLVFGGSNVGYQCERMHEGGREKILKQMKGNIS